MSVVFEPYVSRGMLAVKEVTSDSDRLVIISVVIIAVR